MSIKIIKKHLISSVKSMATIASNEKTCLKTGSIALTIGCMFSGKTSDTVIKANSYKSIGTNVMSINYILDTRYGENKIVSHDKQKIDSINVEILAEIKTNKQYREVYENSPVICINEAQFFSDLKQCVLDFCYNDNKKIFVSGLDGDYKQEPFGQILDLIPHSENVTKLHAFCGICKDGTHAYFTKRIVDNSEQIVIGSEDKYIPVCRQCIA